MDWLKTIAILAVLLLHCSSKYLLPDFVFQPNWYWGVFFESLSRFGVPLFIMVSGFLILPEEILYSDRFISFVPTSGNSFKITPGLFVIKSLISSLYISKNEHLTKYVYFSFANYILSKISYKAL